MQRKYTKNQVQEVVHLFTETTLTYADIARVTDVGESAVHDICKGRTHSWATAHLDLVPHREARTPTKVIYDPSGTKFEAKKLSELSALTGLKQSTINSILTSKLGIGKNGWSAYPQTKLKLQCPLGDIYELNIMEARKLLKGYELSNYQIQRLLSGKSSADWKVLK